MSIDAPAPNGYLYAWIDTDLPGARTITRSGAALVAGASESTKYVEFRRYVAYVNNVLSPVGDSMVLLSSGKVKHNVGTTGLTYVYTDLAAKLLGFDRDPGHSVVLNDHYVSRKVPPGAVWLMGATWEEIDLKRETQFETYRWRRGYGYAWGQVRLMRWTLTMHEDAVEAFNEGWVTTGKVSLEMSEASPFSSSLPGGVATGFVTSVESFQWLDPTCEIAEISMLVAIP